VNAPVADLESVLDAAVAFAARGWRPFPVDHPHLPVCAGTGDRCRRNHEKLGDCPSDKRGKHPVGGWGTMTATKSTEGMLRLWFSGKLRNVGIACGPSGLLVLDEDTLGALTKLADSLGEVVPPTYRVRTSRGWHYYFEDPTNEFGNSAGALTDWHIDVRGGRGSGGYVLGAGSVHWTGHIYEAEDAYAMPAPLPDWIKRQLRSAPVGDPDAPARPRSTGTGQWNDDPRYGSPEALRAQYERHLAAVTALAVPEGQEPNGGAFRHALYLAALDGWRLVDCELTDEVTMLRQVKETVRAVWRANPDDDDRAIVYDEARTRAGESPWVVSDPDSTDYISDEDVAEAVYQREKAAEKRKERLRREVRAELDLEGREPLRLLSASEFLDSPAPEYLVPRMFYRDGLSVVFGAPGAAKSFLVLDIALCLATGKHWRGRSLGRGKVHYIMAEGQATNMLRTQAWLKHHDVDVAELEERFSVVPTPVLLTDAGASQYIHLVERDEPDLIVLDTKNLMFAGKESQGDDYGSMLRVLHRIRDTAKGAAVVLIDHSGLTDDSRVRGSNAQKGGVETEVRVTNENGIRCVEVTRDKSGSEGTKWAFKLVQVPSVLHGPDVDPPAVCVPLEEDEIRVAAPDFERDDNWNDPLQAELPFDIGTFSGKGANAIKPLARFMRYSARGSVGFSLTQARKAVTRLYVDEKGAPKWSEDTVQRAWQSLIDLGRLNPVKGASKTGNHVWESHEGDPE
jgi:hypothetical protein